MLGMLFLLPTEPLPHDLKVAAADPAIASTSRQEEGKAKSAVRIFPSRKLKPSPHHFLSANSPLYLIGQDKITGQALGAREPGQGTELS